jgi:hypothetical protein
MPSLRAANGLPPMARELQVARQPVPMPSATNAANLQMVASLKNATTKVPAGNLYPHALFWQAPVAKNTSMGNIASVGYFIRWDTTSQPGRAKLILTGESGLWKDRPEFAFDLGAAYEGLSPYYPPDNEPQRGHDYLLPVPELRAAFVNRPQIMYERSHRIRATKGKTVGQIFDPYFNRTWEHFCSHQHAPNQEEPSGFDCGVRHGSILYSPTRSFGIIALTGRWPTASSS